jgi:8-hydroxy-5-deazaflavin:NADPH oxidoreductase
VRIGVIGSGRIGRTVATLLARAGHDVQIANSRGPDSLRDLAADRLTPATIEAAAEHGEVVVVATPLTAYAALPAPALAGTVVVDAGNYYPSRDGQIAVLDDDSTTSTEWLAAGLPRARVIKAFNTVFWEVLRDKGDPQAGDDRLVVLVAGDDEGAKRTVEGLIEDIGFAPLDQGGLADGGRRQQPGSELYGKVLTLREARAAIAS